MEKSPVGGKAPPRVALTRLWPAPVLERLAQRYEVQVDSNDTAFDAKALRDALATCDAVCPTVTDRIDATVLGSDSARVRILANFGAGFEHIDLAAASRRGVVVTNTPDVLTEATAELALMLMLMSARRASEGERELRDGRWAGWRPTHLMGQGLQGKTLGLIGFGRIAQATAKKAAAAFAMRIVYHARRRVVGDAAIAQARYVGDLDALIATADVISLHCPGGPATHHLINAARLAHMKPSAIIVNTARGSVIDTEALIAALRDGAIAGAGLDVYETEPLVATALKALDNVTLLPHLGSATYETRIAMGMRAADNLDAFFDGAEPPDRIA